MERKVKMKQKYEAPEMEIIRFGAEDVITTSNPELPIIPDDDE